MLHQHHIALIMPALNEAASLPGVLMEVPAWVDRIVVVDNGSRDATAHIAREHGAEVVHEPCRGYGQACLRGLAALAAAPPDIVAFADADGSDNQPCLQKMVAPVATGQCDFALACRYPQSPGALTLQQRFGNALTTQLIKWLWGFRYHDLGPMRALRWHTLQGLKMQDRSYGWTIEMQIKALQAGLRIQEVPLAYRPRQAGCSKISGTLTGVCRAGSKILATIALQAYKQRWPKRHCATRQSSQAAPGAKDT